MEGETFRRGRRISKEETPKSGVTDRSGAHCSSVPSVCEYRSTGSNDSMFGASERYTEVLTPNGASGGNTTSKGEEDLAASVVY